MSIRQQLGTSSEPMKSIYVQIKLFATLSKYTPTASDHYPLTSGMTAGELANHLNLPANQVKLIFINGRKCPPDTVIKEGDRIGIFPPVGGG